MTPLRTVPLPAGFGIAFDPETRFVGPDVLSGEPTGPARSSCSARTPAAFSRSSRGGDPPNRTSGPTNRVWGSKAMPNPAGSGTVFTRSARRRPGSRRR